MLKSLIKYECRASYRTLLPLYGVILGLSILLRPLAYDRLAYFVNEGFIFGLLMLAYTIVIITTGIMALVIVVQRFRRTMLGAEGYLMHTLPVPMWQHILAKLLAGLAISLSGAVVTVASVIVITLNADMLEGLRYLLANFGEFFAELFENIGLPGFIELLYAMILAPFKAMLMIATACCIGHLSGRHKALAGVGAYIGLTLLESLLQQAVWDKLLAVLDLPMWHPLILFALGVGTLYTAAYYAATHYLLTRRIDLE